jgi:FkbM family methyltransferase
MRRILQDALLWVYRVVFANGILRYQWGRRLFFAIYDVYKKMFEAGEIDRLRIYVPEDSLVVDVGANVGFFTMRFANWVGRQGCVIAIEPEARNFAELQRRVVANAYSDVVEAHNAVADRVAGEVWLAVNPDHPGDHKIGNEGVAVRALTVDGLCSAHGRPLAFMKIDVQGAEMRVLAGAQAVLEKDQPVLFVEVDSAALSRFGTSTDELLSFLSRFGYVPHAIDRTGAKVLPRQQLDALIARNGYTDILFIAEAAR